MRSVCLLFSLAITALSQSLVISSRYSVDIRMRSTNTIEFTFKQPVGKYLSIGFGKVMKDSDMVVCREGEVVDLYSTSYRTPSDDTNQNYNLISHSVSNRVQTYVFTRQLTVSDGIRDSNFRKVSLFFF